MHTQATILTDAKDEMDQLNRMVAGQLANFQDDDEIQTFLRKYGS